MLSGSRRSQASRARLFIARVERKDSEREKKREKERGEGREDLEMKRAYVRTYVHTREKTTDCPTVSPSVLQRPHLRGQTDVVESIRGW